MLLEPRTPEGRDGLHELLAHPAEALLAFDYDGTLSPIVPDPAMAFPQPGIRAALARVTQHVGAVAIVTGRPASVAVKLAGLDTEPGLDDLVVIGHYGMERWDASTGQIQTVDPPPEVAFVRAELPGLLASLGLGEAVIEDKGLSIAVHVRRLADPLSAFAILREPLLRLADQADLAAEPGRFVIELRPHGMDKGKALNQLAAEFGADLVMFAGDDLGDLAAYAEVRRRRDAGRPGLLVCSGSTEVTELAEQADLVVDGPAGVLALLNELTRQLIVNSGAAPM